MHSPMNWKLVDVIQETFHPFLNYFDLVYEVEKEGTVSIYHYYMVSRKTREEILNRIHRYSKIDGVILPLYYQDPDTKEISLLLTRQFRPAIGDYMTAMIAGLKDEKDNDLFDTCQREALEECGALVTDMEILIPPSPSAVCLSDEINAVVLGRIVSFQQKQLEEFEDIRTSLYPLSKVKDMLKDPQYVFPLITRLILLSLLLRFESCNQDKKE